MVHFESRYDETRMKHKVLDFYKFSVTGLDMKKRLPRDQLYDTMKITEEDLNSNEVKEAIMAMKKKEIEREFNIWKASDGRWKAYFQKSGKKRKLITAKSKDILVERLMAFKYDTNDNPTIEHLFEEWVNEKLSFREIAEQTASRYRQDFERYFVKYAWSQKTIRAVNMIELTEFVKHTIANENLTRKAFGNFRVIIRGIFGYAKKLGYIDFNVSTLIEDMNISKRSFTIKKIDPRSEILDDDEVEKLIDYLSNDKNIMGMAILLDLYTGLRVGELVSLKKSDVIDREYIHVQRTEVAIHGRCDASKNLTSTCVQENTKTEAGDRMVYLSEEAQEIVQWLLDNPDNNTEWLFVSKNQKRIVRTILSRHLDKVCNDIGIPHKTMHKLRKTYASRLLDSGVNENIICKQLGHSTIDITRNYYYFTHQARDEQKEQLSKAVKDYQKNRIKNESSTRPHLRLVTNDFKRVSGNL